MPFWGGRCTDRSQGRSPNSNIQIYHVLGVLLNELLSGLHLFPHEDGEDFVRLHRVLQGNPPEGCWLSVPAICYIQFTDGKNRRKLVK